MVPYCVPTRYDALYASPLPGVWGGSGRLYRALRDQAAALFPDSLPDAMRCLCRLARDVVGSPGFRAFSVDARHAEEAETLSELAAIDFDAFFQAYPVDLDDGEPARRVRELADA
jgi:hypothetical protein